MNFPYNKLFDLSGTVAGVTGGAGILGSHFCRGLAAHGASVAVVDIDADAAEKLGREIEDEFDVESVGVECNIVLEESVANMADAVEKALGPINILHNNAGTKTADIDAFFAPLSEFSMDAWREIFSVNLDGMFSVSREIGLRMVERKAGSIIQTSSIYGAVGPDFRIYEGSFYLDRQITQPPAYSAAKAGVVGLTKYLATAWGDANVRVNAITPGGVASGQNDEFHARYSARTPMGRMANAEEMVGALVYLASDASSYVTGQNLIVDGGLTAW